MIPKSVFRCLIVSVIGTVLAVLLTAQAAFAGAGTGLIEYPNPTAFALPGVTEISLRLANCSRAPAAQGFDAWVVRLDDDTRYFAVGSDNAPPAGYVFYVGFYDYVHGRCVWNRGVAPLGNPTPPLMTHDAEWAVVSVFVGTRTSISWASCSNTQCTP